MKKKNRNRSKLLNQAFRFQPGLVFGVFGLAFILGGQMLGAGATTSTTVSACKPVAVSNIDTAQPKSNQVVYKINSAGQGGITTASVKAGSSCVGPLISLVSYKTTSHDGMPRKAQRLYDSQTKPLAATVVTMSVRVPDCYYQTDLAYGLPLDLSTGVDYSGYTNFLWGVTGGSRTCSDMNAASTPTPSITPTPTVTATPRPTVVVQPVETPTATPTPTPKNNGGEATPTPNTGTQGTPTATPVPTPSVIVLAPGEEAVPQTPASTSVFNSLPQAGQAGSLMTFLGALFVTAGLLHIYVSQRHKLLKPLKSR